MHRKFYFSVCVIDQYGGGGDGGDGYDGVYGDGYDVDDGHDADDGLFQAGVVVYSLAGPPGLLDLELNLNIDMDIGIDNLE